MYYEYAAVHLNSCDDDAIQTALANAVMYASDGLRLH